MTDIPHSRRTIRGRGTRRPAWRGRSVRRWMRPAGAYSNLASCAPPTVRPARNRRSIPRSTITIRPGSEGVVSNPQIGNDSLRPERQREIEGGVDLGFFDGIARFSATLYSSKASDVIIPLPLPPSGGGLTQVQNGATIQNRGVELELNINSPTSSKDVQWNLGFLWGKNRNEVLALSGGVTQVQVGNVDVTTVARVGYPTGSIDRERFRTVRPGSDRQLRRARSVGLLGNAEGHALHSRHWLPGARLGHHVRVRKRSTGLGGRHPCLGHALAEASALGTRRCATR